MSAHSETTVVLPANLHARPAGQLTKAAAGFQSTVELDYAGRTVNATSVLGVMGLGATAGASVTVRATGRGRRRGRQGDSGDPGDRRVNARWTDTRA